jgi:uncharacterized protein YutE (UPF0331/DUF86 family)
MDALKERHASAARALATFGELLAAPITDPVARDAAILRFAYTFEAVWKASQVFLRRVESIDAGSPGACVRSLRRLGHLTDEEAEAALALIQDRNLVVHTYREALALELAKRLPGHLAVLRRWLDAVAPPSS